MIILWVLTLVNLAGFMILCLLIGLHTERHNKAENLLNEHDELITDLVGKELDRGG